jgi:hypothetical protein
MIAVSALALALAPAVAHADVTLLVDMHFQSGATFTGDVSFANDYSSVTGVTGTLSGGGYGTDTISWVWELGSNYSSGANNFSTWLMDGTGYSDYSHFIQFAYNYSGAPHLTFTSGVSADGTDNYINYGDPMISGTIGAPEPATWALMGLGFAALGFAGARSRRIATSIA